MGHSVGLLWPWRAARLTFRPDVGWAAAVVVPVVVLLMAYGMHKQLVGAKALTPTTAPKNFKSWWGRGSFIGKVIRTAAAAGFLTLALAGPQSGYKDERLNFGGKDIIVAVDGSHSMMYAEDGRKDKVKQELTDFVEHLRGTDRIGLVVFAGTARTASPVSMDYGNFVFKIGRLEVEARGLKEGSKLAEGIKQSVRAFETTKKVGDREWVIILISDGDVFGEDLEEAIKVAAENKIPVYTVGKGTEQGTTMLVPTEDGKGLEPILTAEGAKAMTRLNETPLKDLASRTGGSYFRADGRR